MLGDSRRRNIAQGKSFKEVENAVTVPAQQKRGTQNGGTKAANVIMPQKREKPLNPIAQIEPKAQLEKQKRNRVCAATKSQQAVAIAHMLPQQKRDSCSSFAEQQHATRLARSQNAV